MKLSAVIKRNLVLVVSSFMLISLFQNCGQPGSITLAPQDEYGKGDPTPPLPPIDVVKYKDYEKDLTVNRSNSKVDVLVVIDNSGSMQYEQANMGTRFSSFLGKLNGLDWQVGITTTDVRTDSKNAELKDGRLLRFNRLSRSIIKSTDDMSTAELAFAETVQRPASEGSGLEQGVKATYRALERAKEAASLTDSNFGFIRSGASLSVILVSDADETVLSNETAGDESTFGEKNKTENLMAYINTNFPGKIFKFNSIIVRDGDIDCLNFKGSGNEGYGKNYQKLTNATSGILGSVCEADYGNQLSVIGDSTVETVKTVTLDCAPVDKDGLNGIDLVVKSGDTVIPKTDYTVSGRIITFANLLPVGNYKFFYTCLAE